jgi:DNA-binding LytR/AlgR family response regulator
LATARNSELVADFDPDRFWQMHRGTIVSVDAVSGVMREEAGKQMQ